MFPFLFSYVQGKTNDPVMNKPGTLYNKNIVDLLLQNKVEKIDKLFYQTTCEVRIVI
jgi:hypothetical protein